MFDREDDIYRRAGKLFWERQDERGQDQIWYGEKSEFEARIKAFEFLDRLLADFEGVSLEEEFGGRQVENDYGQCYRIRLRQKHRLELPDRDVARRRLLEDLTLLYEVRETRARELKKQGYKDLTDLTGHERHGALAREIIRMIDTEDVEELMDYISTRQRYSSWQMYMCSAFLRAEDFLFFDLETMGLGQNTVILIGMGYFEGEYLIIDQLLARSQDEEPALLWEFYKVAEPRRALVSFNGRSFDLNMINQRSVYNFLDFQLYKPHFDMLLFARRVWPDAPNHRLKTLEKIILDVDRGEDVPSDLVPVFYEKYESTGNIGPLVPIVYHNQQDVLTTVRLFSEIKKYFVND